MRRPIVFIHGFAGGAYEFFGVREYLRKKNYRKFYQFCYKCKFSQCGIGEIAEEFSKFLAGLKEKEIDIIAFSMGGIIAEYYLKHYRNKAVRKLITICTPHKGSLVAYLANTKGAIDLRPKSKVLAEVNEYMAHSRTKLYAVYTPFDLMVFPGWNAVPPKGSVKKVFSPGHIFVFFDPRTCDFVFKSLQEK